jgi:hypothetical protein
VSKNEIEEAQKHVIRNKKVTDYIDKNRPGGALISKSSVDGTKVLLRCASGHEWAAARSSVLKGNWCTECSGNRKKTLSDYEALAQKNGGKCTGIKLHKSNTVGLFICQNGHQFENKYHKAKNYWCPKCRIFKGELIVRTIFERMTGRSFPKIRPKWLKTASGHLMELDGFCEDLKIAFEHQGDQHFNNLRRYPGNLSKILARDKLKEELCRINGIALLIVRQVPDRVSVDELKKRIIQFCKANGVPVLPDSESVSMEVFYPNMIKEYSDYCESIGCKLLTEEWPGASGKLKVKCNIDSHPIWEPLVVHIKKSKQCPACSGKKINLEMIESFLAQFNIQCLSKEYSKDIPLEFLMPDGNIKKVRWTSMKRLIKVKRMPKQALPSDRTK